MSSACVRQACLSLCVLAATIGSAQDPRFRRGDATTDGEIGLTDPIRILNFLFHGGESLPCRDAADADDNGALELGDAMFLLEFLFRGGQSPPDPGTTWCGPDPTPDGLLCVEYRPGGLLACRDAPAPGKLFRDSAAGLELSSGNNSFAFATGDVDGDERTDLIATRRARSPSLTAFFGSPDGLLPGAPQPPTEHPLSSEALRIVPDDFDGDAFLDLLLDHRNALSMLIGLGDGSFLEGPPILLPWKDISSHAVRFGDADGDGAKDLFVNTIVRAADCLPQLPCSEFSTLFLLLNDGTGRLTITDTATSTARWYRTFVTGDVNGDGTADALVDGPQGPQLHATRPDGTFAPAVNVFVAGQSKEFHTLLDVDGDGHLDLLTRNPMTIHRGDGSGAFRRVTAYAGAPAVLSDLDGDSITDAVFPAGSLVSGYTVRLGTGDGRFDVAFDESLAGRLAATIQHGDFDNDGVMDLAAPLFFENRTIPFDLQGQSLPSKLIVVSVPGQGDGTFKSPWKTVSTRLSDQAVRVTAGSLNSDRVPDALVAFRSGAIGVLENQGTGEFRELWKSSTGHGPTVLTLGDLDTDGLPDFVLANERGVLVTRNTERGDFLNPETVADETGIRHLTLGDVNGDGSADVVFVRPRPFSDEHTTFVLQSDGAGSFKETTQPESESRAPRFLLADDLDADGLEDLVIVDARSILVMLSRGGGVFAEPDKYPIPSTGLYAAAAADLDADGVLDLVVVGEQDYELLADAISIYYGVGNGTFLKGPSYLAGHTDPQLHVRDMDCDGVLDVVTGPALTIRRGLGDGTFLTAETHLGPVPLAAEDFDGDGDTDVILESSVEALHVLVNQTR